MRGNSRPGTSRRSGAQNEGGENKKSLQKRNNITFISLASKDHVERSFITTGEFIMEGTASSTLFTVKRSSIKITLNINSRHGLDIFIA